MMFGCSPVWLPVDVRRRGAGLAARRDFLAPSPPLTVAQRWTPGGRSSPFVYNVRGVYPAIAYLGAFDAPHGIQRHGRSSVLYRRRGPSTACATCHRCSRRTWAGKGRDVPEFVDLERSGSRPAGQSVQPEFGFTLRRQLRGQLGRHRGSISSTPPHCPFTEVRRSRRRIVARLMRPRSVCRNPRRSLPAALGWSRYGASTW